MTDEQDRNERELIYDAAERAAAPELRGYDEVIGRHLAEWVTKHRAEKGAAA